jgi:hypothetical protein
MLIPAGTKEEKKGLFYNIRLGVQARFCGKEENLVSSSALKCPQIDQKRKNCCAVIVPSNADFQLT